MNKRRYFLITIILAFQVGLFFILKLYFFASVESVLIKINTGTNSTTTPSTTPVTTPVITPIEGSSNIPRILSNKIISIIIISILYM